MPFENQPPREPIAQPDLLRLQQFGQQNSERQDVLRIIYLAAISAIAVSSLQSTVARADETQIARGKYLVQLGGCHDCHTPGDRRGNPDMTRYLGGADVGFETPGLGVFVPPNLTPDRETGLGNWTNDEIVSAIQTGVRPDGRILSPVMPWRNFANLTKSDAAAIAVYLKSLPPVENKVPGPFAADEKPTIAALKIIPPDAAGPTN
jgi:mono/diheme cytochrome c family protein